MLGCDLGLLTVRKSMQTRTVGYVTGGFVLIIFAGNVSRLINDGDWVSSQEL